MRLRHTLLCGFASIGILAMGGIAASPAGAQAAPAANSESDRANAAYDSIFRDLLRHNPEAVTALGIDRSPAGAWARSQLTDRSAEGQAASLARSRDWLERLDGIDRQRLAGLDAINMDAVRYQLAVGVEAEDRFSYGVRGLPRPYIVSQQNGAYQDIPDLLRSQHQIETGEDAQAYLTRLSAFATALDQETQQIGRDAEAGVTPPDFIIDRTLGLLGQLRAGPAGAHELVRTLADKTAAQAISGEWQAEATRIVDQEVFPALDRQIEALRRLRAGATHDAGAWRLPSGADYYRFALRYYTTTEMSADEVHEMGLRQVAEISAEIDRILRAQGIAQGSVGERLAALGRDPSHVYPNTAEGKAELLADLNRQIDRVTAMLPRYFSTTPRASVEVRRVPELTEAGAPGGYYMSPSLDGTRPGAYYINLRDTAEWPRWTLPTLTYHEANPGHHWQIALGQESTRIPVLRQIMGYSAFTEGWGLYAEQLADEAGVYRDDSLGRVGYLQSLLFRATRLVVDTGIHHKRWSREQAIRYMVQTLGDQESSVTGEVERYVANPGQATSYKVGHSRIAALRDSARARLGDRFDIRAFHDTILLSGAMPLGALERLVDEWVHAQSAPAGAGAR